MANRPRQATAVNVWLLQGGQHFSGCPLAQFANTGNGGQLRGARFGFAGFPGVDGCTGHSQQLAHVSSREVKLLAQRGKACSAPAQRCRIFGCDGFSWSRSAQFLKCRLQNRNPALESSNLGPIRGRAFSQGCCFGADLLAAQTLDLGFQLGGKVAHGGLSTTVLFAISSLMDAPDARFDSRLWEI